MVESERGERPRIGILVVAYNAEATLEATLDRIPADFRSQIAEIIVADDASADDTFGAGVRWRRDNPEMATLVIRHLENRGYGGNQKAGYELAIDRELDIVVMLHADGQYAPEFLPQMVAPIINGEADAVFGSRMMDKGAARKGGMPLYKYVGNKILTRVENSLLGTDLSEFHSGYRAYSVAALAAVPFMENTDEFDFDTQIIVQLVDAGKRIVEIPIPTYYGDEICYVDGMKYAKDVVKDVVQYRTSKMGFGTARWISNATEYGLKEEEGSSHTAILRLLREIPPGKVLDVGCSSGLLSGQIRDMGHTVVGVDHAEEPGVRDRLDEFFLADLDEGLPEVGSDFDVVIAADVIEHVRRPEQLLEEMASKLGSDGRLIISTPNFGHWYPRFRVASGNFDYDRRGILDETHLRFFTRKGLQRVFELAKLRVESLDYTGLPFTVLQPGRVGAKAKMLNRADHWLVKTRPTLFGYQFVAVLRPKNFESKTHE
ncbi:bifunctional glycosyltransferase/class I SAM-dependent methyltransferase [Nocardioides sp. LHD-245]|uniref:bifunctional glycosyltransferase/class I SAM-dependent methyltransferase n=1 Tax=Nocardioides sp. LHD-245 TaxID=3051387 RepID=UPI0027E19C20|nr:bifunctional glycosyltransferase/class I SAM-dependent methyltransferase [Nocardioides sp. LHD-245]